MRSLLKHAGRHCPDPIYSFFARSLRFVGNPRWKMEKMISGFAITQNEEKTADTTGGDPGGGSFR